jgi:hypothetical protein
MLFNESIGLIETSQLKKNKCLMRCSVISRCIVANVNTASGTCGLFDLTAMLNFIDSSDNTTTILYLKKGYLTSFESYYLFTKKRSFFLLFLPKVRSLMV